MVTFCRSEEARLMQDSHVRAAILSALLSDKRLSADACCRLAAFVGPS